MDDQNKNETPPAKDESKDNIEGLKKKNEELLAEKKKLQEKYNNETKTLNEKLQAIEKEKLEAANDWKKIAELERSEKETLKQKIDSQEKESQRMAKMAAVKKELDKEGALPDMVEFMIKSANLDDLKYDPDHKVVLGVNDLVKKFRTEAPSAFGKQGARMNHKAPDGTNPETIDMETWRSMDFKKQKDPDVLRKLYESRGITVKK